VKGLTGGAIDAAEDNIGVEGPGEVLVDVADVEEVVRAIELRFSLIRGIGAVEGALGVDSLCFGVGFERGISNWEWL
jgi:hypothetical protein